MEDFVMGAKEWRISNPEGSKRVIVTKNLPGQRWLEILTKADCKVEICTSTNVLTGEEIKSALGNQCDAAIGQLTEKWGEVLFDELKTAGGKATATTPWVSTTWMWMRPQNMGYRSGIRQVC